MSADRSHHPAAASRPRPWPVRLFAPVWHQVFVVPVRQGRLRAEGWDASVQLSVAISALAYLFLMGLVVISGRVSEVWSGGVVADMHPIGLLAALGAFWLVSYQLLLAARPARGLRWLLLGVVVVIGAAVTWPLMMVVGAWAPAMPILGGLALLWVVVFVVALAGARREVSLRRNLLLLVLSGVVIIAPVAIELLLFAVGGSVADASYALIGIYLAVLVLLVATLPIAYASGASFVQITLSTGTWLAIGSAELMGRRARVGLPILCAVLAAANLVAVIMDPPTLQKWTHTAVIAPLAVLASWWGLARVRRRRPVEYPGPVAMGEHLASYALVLGIVISVWYPLSPITDTINNNAVAFALAAIACLLLTERAIRMRHAAAATLFPAVAVALLVTAGYNVLIDRGYGLAQREMSAVAAVGVVVLVIVHLVRRTMTEQVWLLASIGLLICLLMPWRELIAEPIAALLGFSAVGVLFFGLLWRLLTEAEWANGESPAMPRASRVSIFTAYALLAAGATVLLAYSNGEAVFLDLDLYATVGGRIFGYAVPIAVLVGLAEMARYGLTPRTAQRAH